MVRERIMADFEAQTAGRTGGRRPKLSPVRRGDVVENVVSGRKIAAQMVRLYRVNQPAISRIMSAAERRGSAAATNDAKDAVDWFDHVHEEQ